MRIRKWVKELIDYLMRKDFPDGEEMRLTVEIRDGVVWKVHVEETDARKRCVELTWDSDPLT